jgi:AmiR/NasT family two-component response regulator
VNADLSLAAERWPRFAPRAQAEGFLSVHAFPLRHRGSTIGALNVFGTSAGQLEPDDVRIVQALADVATIGLLQERAIRHGEVLTEQLQGALNSRITIEQAKGALAQLRGITPDAAFTLLREYARRHHLRLGDVARNVLTGQGPSELTQR